MYLSKNDQNIIEKYNENCKKPDFPFILGIFSDCHFPCAGGSGKTHFFEPIFYGRVQEKKRKKYQG